MATVELPEESFVKVEETEAEEQQSQLQRGTCVRVDNIPFGFTSDRLKKYFSQYGKVLRANVPLNRATGKSARNRGYVLFAHYEIAKIAAASMNNYLMLKNVLKCSILDKHRVHWKMFRKADDKFHTRNNQRILKLNNPTPKAETADLRKRQMEAIRLLKGLEGFLTAQDLGITRKEVKLCEEFARTRSLQLAAARREKRANLKVRRDLKRASGAGGGVTRPKLPRTKGKKVKAMKSEKNAENDTETNKKTAKTSTKKPKAAAPESLKVKVGKNKLKKLKAKAATESASA